MSLCFAAVEAPQLVLRSDSTRLRKGSGKAAKGSALPMAEQCREVRAPVADSAHRAPAPPTHRKLAHRPRQYSRPLPRHRPRYRWLGGGSGRRAATPPRTFRSDRKVRHCIREGRQGNHNRKAVPFAPRLPPAAQQPPENRKERYCLSREGSGNTGQRQWLSREDSGDTGQRQCLTLSSQPRSAPAQPSARLETQPASGKRPPARSSQHRQHSTARRL